MEESVKGNPLSIGFYAHGTAIFDDRVKRSSAEKRKKGGLHM